MTPRFFTLVLGVVFTLVLAACGGGDAPDAAASQTPTGPAELTAQELENGIGPIKELTLGELDAALAEEGGAVFKTKCSACHKLDQRYVGPELGMVTQRRSPAFIMNMILNPEEMTKRHPVARQLLAEYAAPMAQQNLTEEEARAVLEYLRSAAP